MLFCLTKFLKKCVDLLSYKTPLVFIVTVLGHHTHTENLVNVRMYEWII